ncbi:MAG: nuclear transport factor 2 family protein [Labilithrix sp.]|nr:nuclear transport factor 2 family protein [Labilithrix sp.]
MNARQTLESWLDALEARDAKKILDALADDVELRFESLPRPIVGKGSLADFIGPIDRTCDFIRVERLAIVASGDQAAALLRVQTKLRMDTDLFGERLATAGKSLDLVAALFVTVNAAGKIAKLARVRDNLEVIRQLGISAERMRALVDVIRDRYGSRA